jgi:2-hydroxymuconate-semialdehyde hydrolase
MRGLLDLFAFDRSLVNDELARLRYEASIRPASRSPSAPCSRRRGSAGWMPWPARGRHPALPNETLVIHGREDKVIPLQTS